MDSIPALASSISAVLNVQGKLYFPGQDAISVFDRSYLYGDSLYEVVRSYQGKFLAEQMDAHLERLEASAKLCHMTLTQSREEFRREMERTLQYFHQQSFGKDRASGRKLDAYCRIVVSRGVGKIGFGKSQLLSPTLFSIIVQPVDTPTEAAHQKGLQLQVVERYRNHPKALDPAMKSGNYLNSLLAFLEANAAGFEDALLADFEGNLTEGTTFNLFYARRGIICTPPLDVGILDGITRRTVIRLARENHFEVREVRFPKQRLYEADEVFATSTLKEVMAVTKIDQYKIGKGTPGPITQKLRKAFQDDIELSLKAEELET
ncbi:branched-chain-amino acid aminotransferase [bacterium]|nr:branched-chain-amino acid aminotransferase [bacterium]